MVEEAKKLLQGARSIGVFTGAGISAESGIATFRDAGGFWERYPLDEFGTPSGLLKVALTRPQALVEFLLDLLQPIATAKPNPAHLAIAALEKTHHVDVITQNVDALHQAAGSERVWDVHGSLFTVVDAQGKFMHHLTATQMQELATALAALRGKRLPQLELTRVVRPLLGIGPLGISHRPNIVLFGEAMAEPAWSKAQHIAETCDAMILIGTSGTVYPAASLPERVSERGAPVLGIGPEEGEASLWLTGKAGDILPELVDVLSRA